MLGYNVGMSIITVVKGQKYNQSIKRISLLSAFYWAVIPGEVGSVRHFNLRPVCDLSLFRFYR